MMIEQILYHFRVISLPWWIVIGTLTVALLIFRHELRHIPGNLLIVYIAVVLISTVLTRDPLPFSDSAELLNLDLFGTWINRFSVDFYGRAELLLIFCMLIPVGILYPWSTKRNMASTVLVGFGMILVVETAQWITKRGYFELTDIVDNTVGLMIGYGLYRLGAWLWRKIKS